MEPKSQFEFVPRDTEESEFLDLVDFAVSVETVIATIEMSHVISCMDELDHVTYIISRGILHMNELHQIRRFNGRYSWRCACMYIHMSDSTHACICMCARGKRTHASICICMYMHVCT